MTNVTQQNGVDTASERTAPSRESVFSTAHALASDAAEKAKSTVSGADSAFTKKARILLDRQIRKGAGMIGEVGRAVERAADELDRSVEPLGELAHSLADQIEGYAGDLGGSSASDLVRGASRFTRQQPALVFGLAALAGFIVLRTLKSAPSSRRSDHESAPTGGRDDY